MAKQSHLTGGKIRDVAIVISSVDRSMQRQMLLQLPTEQARLVRQAMLDLGDVSEAELRRALASFQNQARSSSPAVPPRESSNDADKTKSLSPAESALQSGSNETADRLELSQHAHSAPLGSAGLDEDSDSVDRPAMSENERYWSKIPLDDLLTVLRDERGIVIAIVLNQVPAETAKQIVAHLPEDLAVESLQQLATLSETDSDIVHEIHEHLKQRLADYQGPKKNRQANVARLQTLLESVSADRKQAALEELKTVQPNLARDMASKLGEVAPVKKDLVTATAVDELTHDFRRREANFVAATEEIVDDRAIDENILPFRAKEIQTQKDLDDQAAASMVTANESAVAEPFQSNAFTSNVGEQKTGVTIDFSDLKMLSQQDLGTVFKSTDARTVLVALSGATPDFYARFTDMLHPRDAQRLQTKLLSLGPLQMREIDSAQRTLCQNAGHLMATGQIGSLFNLTIMAAA